ncbi:MAG: ATP-binding cassette domain-containing protein [Synergistales bacterium]|nr:ATP-binding cassette domain-containing protein [Synergistales bacterium]
MSGALLEIADLQVELGSFSLRGVNVAIPEGEYCCLLGASGAGKSVLLETVIGAYKPRHGRVFLRGREVTALPPERRRLGIVYQDYMLFPHLNVFNNIAFGLRRTGVAGRRLEEQVRGIASRVGVEPLLDREVQTLSGGEQQRTALARALIMNPEILLLDEPLSSLDVATRERMRALLGSLTREFGVTIFHVTHDIEDVWALATQVVILHDGRVLQTGTPEEVFRSPRPGYVAEFVGARNLISGRVEEVATSGLAAVEAGGTRIYTSEAPEHAEGLHVTLSIRPEEILISRTEPDTSARNGLPMRIRRIVRRGPIVWVYGDHRGMELVAMITVSGAEHLELAEDEEVFFLFKATNVRLAKVCERAEECRCEGAV